MPLSRLSDGNLRHPHQSAAAVSCYPRGVCHCPHNRKPFQARVWYAGRYWSLGYYPSITQAEMAVNRVYAEMAEWKEMQLPPPTLLPLIRRREAAQQATPDPSPPAPETPAPAPPPCPQR